MLVDLVAPLGGLAVDVLFGGDVGVAGGIDRGGGLVGDERSPVGGEVVVGACLGFTPFGFDPFKFRRDGGRLCVDRRVVKSALGIGLVDLVVGWRWEMSRSSKARRCSGVGVVVMVKAGMSSAGWIWLAQRVAKSASRLVKLCTGVSSVVRLRAALASASSERWAADGVGAFGGRGGFVVVDEQDWGQGVLSCAS